MRHYKPSKSFFFHAQRPKAVPDPRKAKVAPEVVGVSRSGEAVPVSDPTSGTITKGELLSRAKCTIESSETSLRTSLRAAAEDIALAREQGAARTDTAQPEERWSVA